MARVLSLLLVALAVAVAAGCGSNGSDPEPDQRALLSARQVTSEFSEETGDQLKSAAGTDPAWEQFNFGLNPPPKLVKEYGIFTIYVVDPGDLDAVDSLLADKTTGEPLPTDAQGVQWEKDELSGTWMAYKRYADNVVLTWFSESTTQQTDERFERLDDVLSALADQA
jgi:hypothetical protein